MQEQRWFWCQNHEAHVLGDEMREEGGMKSGNQTAAKACTGKLLLVLRQLWEQRWLFTGLRTVCITTR